MNVFDVLPGDFFRVLTGKNRQLYVEALLTLQRAFRQSLHIDRLELIDRLSERLAELELALDYEAERTESAGQDPSAGISGFRTSEPEPVTWSGMAHAMLRRLLATGWIEQETKPQSFDLQITLPPYTIDMLAFLAGVCAQDTGAYKNYAFATFSALRTILDPDAGDYLYTALANAWDNCQHLMDALKSLLNNIRRYHRLLGAFVSANDILQGHFEGYQILVNERIFHPMVTRDSVLRFKQPVLGLIDQIMADDERLGRMADQAVAEKRWPDARQALEAILPQLQEIGDLFDGIDAVMLEIQRKNSSYTKASTDKLIYLLNQDRGLKEQLARIIMHYRELSPAALHDLGSGLALYRQAAIDSRSLYARSSRALRTQEAPLKTRPAESAAGELRRFLQSTANRYSHERVMAFMRRCFAERMILAVEEVPLDDTESFILFLMAVIKNGQRNLFYSIEFLDGSVACGAYWVPRLRFIRKEHTA
jgi:hypothetical protein